MGNTRKRGKKQPQQPGPVTDRHDRETAGQQVEEVEKQPAVERGERIATGKAIARGGKRTGHVPGATEQRS